MIVAAGSSQRMGGADKMLLPLMERPLLAHAVQAFQDFPLITAIVLVLRPDQLARGEEMRRQFRWSKVTSICPGGARRQDSVRNGLQHVSECQWVAVHDGARPCITLQVIERGLAAARETGAAVAAVPVKDTVKLVSDRNVVETTPPRERLWAAQTPQIFRYDLLLEAYQSVTDDVTDDATLVERLGHTVKVFLGAYENIKVTTVEDLALAEQFLKRRLETRA
jgi:2-C-methyl-D-erythritol 4-phosphate cytidylyltransferase